MQVGGLNGTQSRRGVTGECDTHGMDGGSTFLWFARVTAALSLELERAGLGSPTFRAPPRNPRLARAIRRNGDSVVVAVRVRGRESIEIVDDLVDGIRATFREASDTDRARMNRALARWYADVSGDLTSRPARVAKRQTQAA